MKSLSIVITNYNKGNRVIYLLKQLEEQIINRDDIEIIIVDDCSTDGSREEIKNFINNANNDSFKLYLNEQNMGPGISRNRGLDLCTGKWITFIDGDDEVVSQYISILSNVMLTTDADLINFDYEIINCINNEEIEYGLNTMLWTKLFRANIFYDNYIRVDEERYKGLVFGEDMELLYLYMSKTKKYLKRNEKTIRYNWGIGICNYPPERYESSIPEGWEEENKWLFLFNHSETVIDFFITNHCNRNCSNCIAMIPTIKPCNRKHSSLIEIKERLDYILPYVDVISILGGETFMHPDLIEIVKMVKNSGVSAIYLYTNGSIEPDNLQEILNLMDSRFIISISLYPGIEVFDYKKYRVPYGVQWRETNNQWFYCGPLKENNLPKKDKICIPKTFINRGNRVYACHRIAMLDQLGYKIQDNEYCELKDFKDFRFSYDQGFTESCKYCLIGTDQCIDVPPGS